jgi:hypothetical protein
MGQQFGLSWALMLCGLGLGSLAWAAGTDTTGTDPRAVRLAALRAEVENLQGDLDTERDALRAELRAIDAQRIDLEVAIRREVLRQERLLRAETELKMINVALGPNPLTARLQSQIEEMELLIREGAPFKTSERQAALRELGVALREGRRTPEQTAARLWAWIEDERRLGRTTGIDRQVITVNGEEVLAEVARVGMVALYWRDAEGRAGQAQRGPDGWTLVTVGAGQGQEEIFALFEALGKGIHVGAFALPLPARP